MKNNNYLLVYILIKDSSENDFKIEDFYTDTNNELVIEGNDLIEKGNGNILNKLNIEVISYKIKYTPYKLTMPLSKSISTFDLEKKTLNDVFLELTGKQLRD